MTLCPLSGHNVTACPPGIGVELAVGAVIEGVEVRPVVRRGRVWWTRRRQDGGRPRRSRRGSRPRQSSAAVVCGRPAAVVCGRRSAARGRRLRGRPPRRPRPSPAAVAPRPSSAAVIAAVIRGRRPRPSPRPSSTAVLRGRPPRPSPRRCRLPPARPRPSSAAVALRLVLADQMLRNGRRGPVRDADPPPRSLAGGRWAHRVRHRGRAGLALLPEAPHDALPVGGRAVLAELGLALDPVDRDLDADDGPQQAPDVLLAGRPPCSTAPRRTASCRCTGRPPRPGASRDRRGPGPGRSGARPSSSTSARRGRARPCSAYQDGETYASGPETTSRAGDPSPICRQCGLARARWATTTSPSQTIGSSVAQG